LNVGGGTDNGGGAEFERSLGGSEIDDDDEYTRNSENTFDSLATRETSDIT
jgi:hypothetical protein